MYKKLLLELEEKIGIIEKDLCGKTITEEELRHKLKFWLSHCDRVKMSDVNIGDVEEHSDYLRVVIKKELYPELLVGYTFIGQDENFCNLIKFEYIDMDL